MVGHGGSSAGSYLADPTSPIPSHYASIVATSTVRVKKQVSTLHLFSSSAVQWHSASVCWPPYSLPSFVLAEWLSRKTATANTSYEIPTQLFCKCMYNIQITFYVLAPILRMSLSIVCLDKNKNNFVKLLYHIITPCQYMMSLINFAGSYPFQSITEFLNHTLIHTYWFKKTVSGM